MGEEYQKNKIIYEDALTEILRRKKEEEIFLQSLKDIFAKAGTHPQATSTQCLASSAQPTPPSFMPQKLKEKGVQFKPVTLEKPAVPKDKSPKDKGKGKADSSKGKGKRKADPPPSKKETKEEKKKKIAAQNLTALLVTLAEEEKHTNQAQAAKDQAEAAKEMREKTKAWKNVINNLD
ncbi:hypothetical protein U1Q18_011817 [Sarracenia purpurea var. burkii]